jgi:ribulose-phosphate 3-epimerase
MQIKILPSLLAADIGRLEDAARKAEASGGDALHIDVMDGHFVPNLSLGPEVVSMAKRCVRIPLSVHLMLTHPDRYVKRFAEAGADSLLIHIESHCHVPAALWKIRDLGMRAGITLNPETPAEAIYPVIEQVDEVLCMTVRPGYGGQAFMREVLPKIRVLRDYANAKGKPDMDILVDGGINGGTTALCARAGANAFVAGTALYEAEDMTARIAAMRQQATEARGS